MNRALDIVIPALWLVIAGLNVWHGDALLAALAGAVCGVYLAPCGKARAVKR